MEKLTKTITSIFMVPTLYNNREGYSDWRDSLNKNGYLNGYEKDCSREENYEDACYVLFKPNDIDKFREFLDSEYERTPNIIEDYDLPHKFIIIVYKLDPNFKGDFDLIRRSKYSKTSPEFQALFPRVVKIIVDGLHRDELSLQTRIFKRTPDLRKLWEDIFQADLPEDSEVYEGYHEEREPLNELKLEQDLEKETVL